MSLNVDTEAFRRAALAMQKGGVIAYPTEGVYGLGCDPMSEKATLRLLALKQRAIEKGLILIGADWEQIAIYVETLPDKQMQPILESWPGPVTWILPAKESVPTWIRGKHKSVAVRMTDHPQAKELCETFGGAVVSTSANLHGEPPLKNNIEVYENFHEKIDYILPGRVGLLDRPTRICDGLTGKVIRE